MPTVTQEFPLPPIEDVAHRARRCLKAPEGVVSDPTRAVALRVAGLV